ncbi:MAG: HD-GYP domain-containing protein [Syntrophomonadaceae bacterium]|jgi:HD-GYP domain-containing protein (c-di-GMP phosphodiesterase class II)|nr:HD-GYP domain-containing protein [Syntrophomonadaceae bacterium]
MFKLNVSDLNIGTRLGKDLFSADGSLLLKETTIINKDHLDRFKKRGIDEVYIAEEIVNAPQEKKEAAHIPNEKAFEKIYLESTHSVKEFLTKAKLGQPLEAAEVLEIVDTLFTQLFDGFNIFKNISILKEKDDYLFKHSINVAILCMLSGRWMNMNEHNVKQLGLAGVLHDIGKVFIDDKILNKDDALTNEEYQEMKKHAFLGYNYVNKLDWVNNPIAEAVLLHHERMDGRGYPNGVKDYGNNIFAPVLAVCDVYDAVTSERVYSNKRSPFAAADILWEESFGRLDPVVTSIFFNKIGDLLLGSTVKLSNGEIGKVVFTDAFRPTRPLIKVGNLFYNLGKEREIHIMEIIS